MDIKPPQYFIDSYGTFDTLSHKGGDSCQRVGMYWSLMGMMEVKEREFWNVDKSYEFQMRLHHVHPGNLIRHPNLEWDASDFDRMSRDQLQPMIIAAGYWSKQELKKITKGHLKRGFLFANNTRRNGATKKNHGKMVAGEVRNYDWKMPDPTGPEIWGNFIRAYRAWYLWPFLVIFDLEMLFGAIRWRLFPKHNITMNHTLSLFQAMDILPTPISWLASKIMAPRKLITLLSQHFRDFTDDMTFFEGMFRDTLRVLR